MCVRVTEKEWELERDASPRDVSLWCFPNQGSGTSSDEDVMSLSDFLSKSTSCFKMLLSFFYFTHFLFACFHVSICLSLCVFAHVCSPAIALHLLLLFMLRCRRVGVCCSFFFFYEWAVLFTLWQSYFCQLWWWTHTVWPHQLPLRLLSGLWLAEPLLSMATVLRLRVCVFSCACVCARGPECWGVSVGFLFSDNW